MQLAHLLQLMFLAAIWGGSFLFMRMAVSAFGPVMLIESRVALAALFLLVVSYFLKRNLALLSHWKHYCIVGLLNTALPFLLIAYAAQTLTASLLSVLNATSPIWGAVIGLFWARKRPSAALIVGLILGITGVASLVGLDTSILNSDAAFAIFAAISAAFSYGLASVYTQNTRVKIQPFNNAHGSMWAATLIMLPLAWVFPLNSVPTPLLINAVIALGILCTGVAYLIFFKLINEIGGPAALSVTFLVPLFGILWGHLFLGEPIGWHTLMGTALILTGTSLVTGFRLSVLRLK